MNNSRIYGLDVFHAIAIMGFNKFYILVFSTFVVSSLTYFIIKKPFMKLRNKIIWE